MSTKETLGVGDIIAIVVVLAISACIGIYFRFSGGRQKTTKEFLMAGRSMSPFPVVFSLIVTFVSAVMMLGIPSEVYSYGLYRMLAYICSTFSNVISAYIFLPVYFQMGESVSVYEYLERRFGKHTRKFSSILFILQTVFYMAVVLYAPALALSAVTPIKLYISIISIGGICTLYCCLGGLKAVLWTDVFQAIIMYICIFAIFIKGVLMTSNIPHALSVLHSRDNSFFSFDLGERYTLWNCLLYGFLYGLCNYGCNQSQVQRMLSVKSLKLSQRAVIFSVPLAILFITLNFSLGIILYANYYDQIPPPYPCLIKKQDEMIPYFIMHNLTEVPGLAGLCVAGIFSGALSTVSSSVNSLSAVTMEDFVQPLFFSSKRKLTDAKGSFLVKFFAFFYGILGIACAFAVQKKGLIYAYTVVYGTISGPVLGLFTLGMLTSSANEKGSLTGLITGILTTLTLGIVSFNKIVNCPPDFSLCNANSTFDPFPNSSSYIPTIITNIHTYNATMDTALSHATFKIPDETSWVRANILNDSNRHIVSTKPICKRDEWFSIMWLLCTGFLVTTVVGYVVSLGTGKTTNVNPALLSPFIRKWILKPLPTNPEDQDEELEKFKSSTPDT